MKGNGDSKTGIKATLKDLRRRLEAFEPDPNNPHDAPMKEAVRQALKAAREGNFGVGAVLCLDGEIIEKGRNRVFHPHFNSGAHAEMVLLDRREHRARGGKGPRSGHKIHWGTVLYTSLQPCPMCVGRLVISGVSEVYFAVEDTEGGGTIDHLPLTFKRMLGGRIIAPSTCSPEFRELALAIFLATVPRNDKLLAED